MQAWTTELFIHVTECHSLPGLKQKFNASVNIAPDIPGGDRNNPRTKPYHAASDEEAQLHRTSVHAGVS